MFRRSLFFAFTVIFIFSSAVCLGDTLPGTLFDQDKSHLASETIFGPSWTNNWYMDINGNDNYDPGELWSDEEYPGWIYTDDDSCWMAVASNIVQYLGGGDWYYDWAYNGIYSGLLGQKTFETIGGDAKDLLESLGHTTRNIGGTWEYYTGWHGNNPADWMLAEIQQGSPLKAGIGIVKSGPYPDTKHAITVYGIDTTNETIVFADSDTDYLGNDIQTRDYTWDGNHFRINCYGHSSGDIADWEYVYNVTSVDMTGLNFLVTPTHGSNGSISPSTTFTAEYGEDVSFTATPNSGYVVDKWYVNGIAYFSEVTSIALDITLDTTVLVTFKPEEITPSQITVAGSTTPAPFEISMEPSSSSSRYYYVPVYNTGLNPVVVSCSKSGTAANWTTLESSSFNLGSRETKNFKVTFTVPDGTSGGSYYVNLIFNNVTFRVNIRVAATGETWIEPLSPSSGTVNGNSSTIDYTFDNSSYNSFVVSGKYQTHAQTYRTLSQSQHLNAGNYNLYLFVFNRGATNQNLIVKMNNIQVGVIKASDVSFGWGGWITSIPWSTLEEGVNVISFGLSQWNSSSETALWEINDNMYIRMNSTSSAFAVQSIRIPDNHWRSIDDGYMDYAAVRATISSVSNPGRVQVYNNGVYCDYVSVSSSDAGKSKIFYLSRTELDHDNLFVFKGDPANPAVASLSNLKLEIVFYNSDPILEITKQLSTNRLQIDQQATVTVQIENIRENSSTGFDTRLTDSLPSGLQLFSGVLNKTNLGRLEYEDVITNTYTIKAVQAGRYILPSAKVIYETIQGEEVTDESMPIEILVLAGQLNVDASVSFPTITGSGNILFNASVTDGSVFVSDTYVYGVVQLETDGIWETIYTIPMGRISASEVYTGMTPVIQTAGNYRAYVCAQKELYGDGQSATSEQDIVNVNPDINQDGFVDYADFSELARKWLLIDCSEANQWCGGADVNRSNAVDIEDLIILAEHWLSVSSLSEFPYIPGGTFQMGDSLDGISTALPVHSVTLSPFYMGRFEVTNAQYCAFLNSALSQGLITVSSNVVYQAGSGTSYPYCDTYQSSTHSQINWNGSTFSVRTKGGRSMVNDPMVLVSWYGAVTYSNWRSQQEGKPQCYNLSTWACDFSKKGYRLPTEAQWEYAARGGLSGRRFPWGDTITHSQANYFSSSSYSYDTSPTRGYHPIWNDGTMPYTSPVGSFAPNGYGLYDMAGNVWDWCNDWHGYYTSSSEINPTGPTTGTCRVLRGGSWGDTANDCRVAGRGRYYPTNRDCYFGFRLSLDF